MKPKQTEGDLNTLTKQMLSKILIASPERIFIYDVREQRNIFSNRSLAKFLGFPPEQKREMGTDQFQIIIHPEDAPRLDEHYRINALIKPTAAPPAIRNVELILNRNSSILLTSAIIHVQGSIRAACPSCQVTAAISPSDATFTPSNKPLVQLESRNFGISGLLMPTKIKAGRKIPMVANSAPGTPPNK